MSVARVRPEWLLAIVLCGACYLTSAASLPIKEQVQCSATLSPQSVVARQFDNSSTGLQIIRCSARISKESFTHPVFDLSFGLTPITGIFIVRGRKECSSDSELCWSEFQVPSQALRELLLPSSRQENAIDAGDTSRAVSHTPAIEYTCNVADSSRNSSFAVRCADSGVIRFPTVLKYGDRCSSPLTTYDECGHNMECSANRCVCMQGFMPYYVTSSEVICVEKAGLGQKCNFTPQCTQMSAQSLCEFDSSLGYRICKCLSGFEEVTGAQDQLYCAIKRVPITSTTASPVVSEEVAAKETEDVVVFNEPTQQSKDAQMKSDDTDLKSLVLKLGKANQVGLIVFVGVILAAILLVAIIIRLRNHGEMKVQKGDGKSGTNGQAKRVHSKEGPLLGAVHPLSEDEEEEVDVHIDDTADHNQECGQLIDSDERDAEAPSRATSQSEPFLDAQSSRAPSASHGSDNETANFNYNAKQSVV